jgi:hypothetical protein
MLFGPSPPSTFVRVADTRSGAITATGATEIAALRALVALLEARQGIGR